MVKINRKSYPFLIITFLYFLLGFVNILFAYLAVACMIIPFVMVSRTGKKPWCSTYCPRADFLSLFRIFKSSRKAPAWLNSDNTRKLVFQFFCINLFFIVMSTFMVSRGQMEPIEYVRFLIAFTIPVDLPQIWAGPALPPWAVHLAYRFYSIMFTSTVLGVVLASLYKPRTWCAVCPVNTLSTAMIRQITVSEGNE
ncbi:4Fe-4S binding protein [Spirochaeta isovalerica]|uniref:Polyferredoxin n=1 Tax=Spirochaeta isovalerica TaxID=150 RepID=A0A841REH5_9SPIO|nr:4Fe-4S binding protein [Spirochaeta isovalerica]MBB6481400.1 polyferredoxin [Spirochaeta isovalerica]